MHFSSCSLFLTGKDSIGAEEKEQVKKKKGLIERKTLLVIVARSYIVLLGDLMHKELGGRVLET